MRKEYKSPEMEVVEMNNNDIITTSGFDNNNLMDEYFGNDKDGYNFSDFYYKHLYFNFYITLKTPDSFIRR